MRDYVSFLVLGWWCCAWWVASVYFFVTNWKRYKKIFGYTCIPVAIFIVVFSPGLVIVEIALSIGKWLRKSV